MSGAPLIALWPSDFAYLLPMNHCTLETQNGALQRLSLLSFSFTLSPSFCLLLSLIFSQLSLPCLFPTFTRLSRRLDLAPCIPSCLIKACIINTATSLSILLRRSYDCYIKFKLFRCNSLLMSPVIISVSGVCLGEGGGVGEEGREWWWLRS